VDTLDRLSLKAMTLDLFGESLCPDTVNAIVDSYMPAINKGILGFINLRYVPFGNCQWNSTTPRFDCQHGPSELNGNKLQLCLIDTMGNLRNIRQDTFGKRDQSEDAIKAVFAMYSKIRTTGRPSQKSDWASYLPNDLTTENERSIAKSCAGSDKGLKLMKEAEEATPAHDWIPWTVVNGQPLGIVDRNYANHTADKYICGKLIEYTLEDVKKFCKEIEL
jgi:interferon gamma-inducible protein 30